VAAAGAVFVTPGSAEGLAVAVLEVASDKNLAHRLGVSGRGAFQSRYTLDAVVEQMANLYRGVAASG